MPVSKLVRFEQIKSFSNVLELDDCLSFKGKWAKHYFKNNAPIILELGCGKGEATMQFAAHDLSRNYIGIDYKGNRIWKGAKEGLDRCYEHVVFLRFQIEQIDRYFGPDEVEEIWLTFPDPQPQKSREKKRLTSPRFLKMYAHILAPNGKVHLKTDNEKLYKYSLETLLDQGFEICYKTDNLYQESNNERVKQALNFQTFYEKKFLLEGMKMCYIQCKI